MITLYTFGPAFGLPDASPFVIKTHVLLKMAGQPYQVNCRGMRQAPKGKLPYIDDEGVVVADSTFIRWHLEKKYGVDFDAGLNTEQRAVAWAAEKLLEDNLYWVGVYGRWAKDENFRKVADVFFKPVPWLVRGWVERLVRRRILKSLHAQGMGRHSEAEIAIIARRGMESLSLLLGDKPFFMGHQPTAVDAILFGTVTSALCPEFTSPMGQVTRQFANLVAYEARMRERFFGGSDSI